MRRFLTLAILAGILLSFAPSAHAAGGNVTISTNSATVSISPFSTIGGIAAGDLGTDGTAEILVAAGNGEQPTVAVYRQNGSKIGSFLAYDPGFTRGVNVAVCDVDGDGTNEIITGARFGGGPHVRIFDSMGNAEGGFFAYASDFRGGVHVACGDIDNDGIGDIVTGAGPTGGPHIKVFAMDGTLRYEVFDGSARENTGSYVKVDDGTIYTARIGVGDTTVHAYTVNSAQQLTAIGSSTFARDTLFSTTSFSEGTATASITSELHSNTAAKVIKVDISEQRLYRYEYGIEVASYLVSTGVYGMDTPYGNFSVLAKLPVHLYSGSNYYYPNVKWNLRFKKGYYIHTAYWHNNFGRRMSHGCINMRESEAGEVYSWADVTTPVEIVQ